MIENHVVNFDLSRRMYDLGVKKESIFHYNVFKDGTHQWAPYWESSDMQKPVAVYQAYIASELFEMLPKKIPSEKYQSKYCYEEEYICTLKIITTANDSDFTIKYTPTLDHFCEEANGYPVVKILQHEKVNKNNVYDENICNALAKMLVYLIENQLIKMEDINRD